MSLFLQLTGVAVASAISFASFYYIFCWPQNRNDELEQETIHL